MVTPEIVMERVRQAYLSSPHSLADIAERMGYENQHSRKFVHQLISDTIDPHLSTLLLFAYALDMAPSRLLVEPVRVSVGCRP